MQTAEKPSKAELIGKRISLFRPNNTARELQMFMPQEDDGEYNTSVRNLEQWFPNAGPLIFFAGPQNIFFPQIMPMLLLIKKLILCLADF